MKIIIRLLVLFCGFFAWFYPAYFMYVNLHLPEVAGLYLFFGWWVGLFVIYCIEDAINQKGR